MFFPGPVAQLISVSTTLIFFVTSVNPAVVAGLL